MSASYKLTYFPVRGRAELARLMLEAAAVPYENDFVKRDDGSLAALKASGRLPYGQVPALTVNDTVIVQSNAIALFLARELGFYPSSNLDAAVVDSVLFALDDVVFAMIRSWGGSDEDKKKFVDTATLIFTAWDKLLDGKTWVAADKPTLADFVIFAAFEWVPNQVPALKDLANVSAMARRLTETFPALAAYVASPSRLPVTSS